LAAGTHYMAIERAPLVVALELADARSRSGAMSAKARRSSREPSGYVRKPSKRDLDRQQTELGGPQNSPAILHQIEFRWLWWGCVRYATVPLWRFRYARSFR